MMKIFLVMCIICFTLLACENKNPVQGKWIVLKSNEHEETCSCVNCKNQSSELNQLSLSELSNLNVQMSKRYNEDFRSWNYNSPENWDYLSGRFADEIIETNPHASINRNDIENLFKNNLNQRSETYYSDSKNKKQLMGQINAEFKFKLSYLIGIEGYNKWQILNKEKYEKFNQTRDSLMLILAIETDKKIKSKKQKL